jgi:tryptophan 2,3-dioxygenase
MSTVISFKFQFNLFQLDQLLDCLSMTSEMAGKSVHDEHLFIITHQGKNMVIRVYQSGEVNQMFSFFY